MSGRAGWPVPPPTERPGQSESPGGPAPRHRWVAVAMVVLWTPVALVGLALTLTIFWLPFGLPMLAGTLPARVGWRILRGRPFKARWATVGVVAPWVFVGSAVLFLAGLPWDVLEGGGSGWLVLVAVAVALSWLSAVARTERLFASTLSPWRPRSRLPNWPSPTFPAPMRRAPSSRSRSCPTSRPPVTSRPPSPG